MTEETNSGPKALDRLAEALIDDILSTSDEEILAEFQEGNGDPKQNAAYMRQLFEGATVIANKGRMAAAKAGAAASNATVGKQGQVIDFTEARRQLRSVLDNPDAPHKLTLAARKESELSDADIASMVDDLRELSLLSADSDNVKP